MTKYEMLDDLCRRVGFEHPAIIEFAKLCELEDYSDKVFEILYNSLIWGLENGMWN